MIGCIKNNRGQAMVEFALVVPVLLLIAIGIMEFGLVIHQYMVVAEASREGARTAAVGRSDAAVTTAIENAAVGLNSTKLKIAVQPAERTTGEAVTVKVEYPVKAITPMFSVFFPEGFSVNGVTTMRVE